MAIGQIVVEKQSRYDFDTTVQKVLNEAEQRGWQVPVVHDLQQSLAKSGKSVKPVKVIEICKPQYSGKLLELSEERIMSVMMPCRIAVYQKSEGNIYITLVNGSEMAAGMSGKIADIMKAASDETFEIIKSVTV